MTAGGRAWPLSRTGGTRVFPELRALRLDVMRHARAEERYEFNDVRRHADKARLASMATALRAAQAMAPTTRAQEPSRR